MALDPRHGVPSGSYGHLRASTADRERAVDVLKASFAEGRLTKDEYDERVGEAYSSRTYAELERLTADLPAGPLGALSPQPTAAAALQPSGALPVRAVQDRTNGMAVASLVCSLFPGIPALVAIFLGLSARRQIRQLGGRGVALANAGIVIGATLTLLAIIYGLIAVV